MKVYTKKEDRQSMIPRLLLTIGFFIVPIGIILSIIYTSDSIVDALIENAVVVAFAIMFFAFDMLFIVGLFMPPKGYRAILTEKKEEFLNDTKITYLTFEVKGKDTGGLIPNVYLCYVYDDTEFEVDKIYSIGIKEYNWEIKYAEKIDNTYSDSKGEVKEETPGLAMKPVFYAILFILLAPVIASIAGMYIYPDNFNKFLVSGIISLIVLVIAFIAGRKIS